MSTESEEADDRALQKHFLKACQQGKLDEVKQLAAKTPKLFEARSASKGYSPMHWAAMGGATELCEWLEMEGGLSPDEPNPDGVTPLQVALEYKRLHTARRLQQLRDQRRDDATRAELEKERAAEEAAARAAAEEEHARAVAAERARAAAAAAEAAKRREEHEAAAAASRASANLEAAAQALAAGQKALRSGDMMKAVRLLRKASALSPNDPDIAAAKAEAEREMNAVLKEQEAEKAAARQDAANEQERWNHPTPAATKPSTPASSRKPHPAPTPPPSQPTPTPRSTAASATAEEASASSAPSSSSSSQGAPSAKLGSGALAWLIALLSLFTRAAAFVGVDRLVSKLVNLPNEVFYRTSSFLSRRWEQFFALNPESRDNFMYLAYYWRARLRWPLRLVGVLLLLLLAWRYPWYAYATFVIGAGAGATFLSPHLPWTGALTHPQAVVGAASAGVGFFCWLLPYSTAYLLGFAVWGLLLYVSWQLCAAISALLLFFYFMPTYAMIMVGVIAWFLFLVILPRICILATELSIGMYYFPFHWPFGHVVLLALLLSGGDVRFLVPSSIMLGLLYFFPRVTLSLVGLFILYALWPLLAELRKAIIKFVEDPYGMGGPKGEMPAKVKGSDEAAEIANGGKTHYEVLNAHRGASPAEIKACYKRMALMLHPDKNPHETAAAAFKKVSDAFAVLGSAYERAEYDAGLDDGTNEGFDEAEDGVIRPPEDMPSGPPGLKKRRARPTGARGGRR